jgi:hypothetical protein
MAEEEDRERRQEELEALDAIYGEAFTLGRWVLCFAYISVGRRG